MLVQSSSKAVSSSNTPEQQLKILANTVVGEITVNIVNKSENQPATFSLYKTKAATPTDADLLNANTEIGPSVIFTSSGIVATANESIWVKSTSDNIVVRVTTVEDSREQTIKTGSQQLVANNPTPLYDLEPTSSHSFSDVSVCNTGATDVSFKVWISNETSPTDRSLIIPKTVMRSGEHVSASCFIVSAGERVWIEADSGNCSVSYSSIEEVG